MRLDSGDLLELSVAARRLLDEAGMSETRIAASGDLDEDRIAELVAADAPVDIWGVGTDLGTSRDSPVVNGVYKLVADRREEGWRGVWKHSPDKETVPGPKQVFRRFEGDWMSSDVIAPVDEEPGGRAAAGVRDARRRAGAARVASADARALRRTARGAARAAAARRWEPRRPEPYPVIYSERLRTSRAIAER